MFQSMVPWNKLSLDGKGFPLLHPRSRGSQESPTRTVAVSATEKHEYFEATHHHGVISGSKSARKDGTNQFGTKKSRQIDIPQIQMYVYAHVYVLEWKFTEVKSSLGTISLFENWTQAWKTIIDRKL